MTPDDELLHIDQVIDRLDARFPDLPRESIEQVVRSAHAHFANGKVRDFVPLLVERLAREKLQGLVPVDPVVPLTAPTAGAEMDGAEVIARRRKWPGWLRGWYPDTRMAIVVEAPEPLFSGSDRT
ncbi:three-helix bundle dimerization domain-containing protein [Rhodococcus sp. NPDC056960]|uniref:three-helix bundle dimerization domain-containing protein n=1 Tax=Rhodococcus sp. NPDC056960 TaxID=3345982 RepID=UPI0036327DEF